MQKTSSQHVYFFFAKGTDRCRAHTIRECDGQLEQTTLPDCLFLARNTTFPNLQVEHTLLVLLGTGIEAKGMVLSPLLPRGRE